MTSPRDIPTPEPPLEPTPEPRVRSDAEAERRSGQSPKVWPTLWRSLAAVVGMLVLLELGLRIFLVSPSTTEPDPVFEYFQRPYSHQVYSSEGYSRSITNGLGFFDDDPWVPKPPLRALLLGDSYAEATQVYPAQNFAAVAEHRVEGLEVCNAGRSGWAPPDFAAFVELRAELFDPDLVVIQINDTDLEELHRSWEIHVRGGEDGYELVIPPPLPEPGIAQRLWRKMKQSSALFTQVTRRVGILQGMEKRRLARHFSPKSAHGATTDADSAVPDDAMEILLFLHQRMQEHYDDIVYLYIPRILYEEEAGARIRNPERRALYQEFARRAGAPLVDPSEELLLRYQETRQPQHGFQNSRIGHGHANVHGHEVIGAQLAAELEKHLP